ncbi:MAG: tRNA uridine-5-carboxymethylaminomethyl(34) synthesis GTPase MnmE [Paracoccus sp. (in: a-proteobacteria)]|nr:tRNA uridine-5-carboxymethylaminomethyl(34) synthesis GTPase MnmE [Paracoccus sp. (in: a-proteobacteria)]
MDTIFAEATPVGRGGVSVIRLSGPEARRMAEALAGGLPEPRYAYFRALRDAGELIDHALVLWFAAGASFTGEEAAELQLHGAPVVVRRVADALRAMGARDAEAGEFTLRSFMAGRMNLAEVEGLSDLLAAETEAQRRQAVALADGALGRLVESWRADLVQAGAMLTAAIDFVDEEIPDDVAVGVAGIMARVRASIDGQLAGFPAADRLRHGFSVAIVGPPNAGKSSLLNYIAQRELAIVTDIPGTTRDVVEYHADLRGLPVSFLDTAGIRETDDAVEQIGVTRALERASDADLRVFLGAVDGVAVRDEDIITRSKGDLTGEAGAISATTGQGMAELLDQVYDILSQRMSSAGLVVSGRQAKELKTASAALVPSDEPEIASENIRRALHSLARLIGSVDAEDYLDVVFSSFCIGK